ncbi:MAG: COG4280 domain-containing protein [Acetobacteraceae bacterium]
MVFFWAHAGPTLLAAFLASLVECIEAMTVVLAVGAVRGWRGALAGSFAALVVLLVLVAVLGPALDRIPLDVMQAAVGTLLLLFGMRWLRKAILRAAGVIASRDEEAAYSRQRHALEQVGGDARRWDGVAIATAFKITMIEGVEVVFIVIAMGAAGHGLLAPAGAGALAALLVVLVLGLLLHRPVASIPENLLKLVVGILLTSFGTFWVGEGMGLSWPGGDWSVLALIAGYTAITLVVIRCCHPYQDLADGHPVPDEA